MYLSPSIVPLLLLVYLPFAALGDHFSPKECENLGFTGLALCSDCNTLAEFVKDGELVSDCLRCCSDDTNDSLSKVSFSGAILEVCMRKLVLYPEVVAFIEEEKDQFSSVKVQYVYASPPKLVMLDEDGNHVETISWLLFIRLHLGRLFRYFVSCNGTERLFGVSCPRSVTEIFASRDCFLRPKEAFGVSASQLLAIWRCQNDANSLLFTCLDGDRAKKRAKG